MATATAPPRRTSWGNVNSRQFIKSYDKSPISSPKASPPSSPPISRNNSTTSINSFRSEPAWTTSRHHSESSAFSAKPRLDSTASQASVQSTASQKKAGFMGGLFHKSTKEEKEKKKKETEKIILGSRHAAAVKTKLALDPAYREFQEKHRKPSVPTAGIGGHAHSSHSTAAEQEARFPHSGSPHIHGSLDLPSLTRIESHDEADSDEDSAERTRREWNSAPENNLAEIPEVISRHNSTRRSPWVTPGHSRETSPNRSGVRGSIAGQSISGHSIGGYSIGSHSITGTGHKRQSYAGGYHRDETGRWTKKTPPLDTHHHPPEGGVDADLLAASLAERLHTTA